MSWPRSSPRCLAKEPSQRPLASELAARLSAAPAPVADAPGAADPFATFLGELRRRHVYQVGAAYTVAALGVLALAQGVDLAFALSRTAYQILVGSMLAGFPVALVLAWAYDIRAGRIHRTSGPRATPQSRALLWGGLLGSLLFAAVVGWLLLG